MSIINLEDNLKETLVDMASTLITSLLNTAHPDDHDKILHNREEFVADIDNFIEDIKSDIKSLLMQ